MSEIVEKNAIIKGAKITVENGLLDCWLDLDYGGAGQGFGGFSLYLPKTFKNSDPSGPNYAGHFLWRVLEIAGVTRWENLVGKTVRVRAEHSKVHSIGHIVLDDWFNPTVDFRDMEIVLNRRSERP